MKQTRRDYEGQNQIINDSKMESTTRTITVATGGYSLPKKPKQYSPVTTGRTVVQDVKGVSNAVQEPEDVPEGQTAAQEDEPDLVDHQQLLRKSCEAKSCAAFVTELHSCTERVNSREKTMETCEQEVYDVFHCVEHCVSKNLFRHLK